MVVSPVLSLQNKYFKNVEKHFCGRQTGFYLFYIFIIIIHCEKETLLYQNYFGVMCIVFTYFGGNQIVKAIHICLHRTADNATPPLQVT